MRRVAVVIAQRFSFLQCGTQPVARWLRSRKRLGHPAREAGASGMGSRGHEPEENRLSLRGVPDNVSPQAGWIPACASLPAAPRIRPPKQVQHSRVVRKLQALWTFSSILTSSQLDGIKGDKENFVHFGHVSEVILVTPEWCDRMSHSRGGWQVPIIAAYGGVTH